MIYWPYFR